MAKSKVRRSVFVPRILVRGAALASVIPACAVASCGSNPSATGPSTDARADSVLVGVASVAFAYDSSTFGVAAVAYPAYESGTPDAKSDVEHDARDGASDVVNRPDVFFGVAAVAYPAYESGPPDGKSDAHDDASDATHEPDVYFSVADAGYQGPREGGRG